ncbi:VWA domain-containing protein [Streptomyces sp. YIM 98790]|uniref:VWA domain-containing protein n=1 Tax=Streptomyces sp. YIM 98790 TaxID=2689077 RepID=UPI00140C975F|nr:VWA domain-containing protein [Streptomyces sp. YIM 98790]
MIIGRRLATALLAAFAAVLTWAFPAHADEHAGGTGEAATPPPQVNLVLDVSGSMREKDIDGGTRMAAAQQAFNEVIDAVPEEVHLGIRTLGADYPGDDIAKGCVDSAQLYPIGPVDRTEAKTAVATLRPTGWTPIGYALRGAVEDFGDHEGTRRIVLITDGEDSCGEPDPCDVARELAASGTHLTVDTLGLTPADAKVREQLSCIAEATGGTYTAVQDTDQLTERLKQIVDQTADNIVIENPTVIEGSADCADAPLLTAGVYRDREEFGEHRWYRVQLAPGRELRAAVSVSADRPVDRDYGVLLRALDENGRELARGSEAGHGRIDVVSTGLRYPAAEEAEATICLELSTSFSAPESVQRTPGLPVELTVDLTAAPDAPSDVASHGLARGWVPLVVLTVTGLLAGLLWGALRRIF